MNDEIKLIDTAVYGDMRIDYLMAGNKYACRVCFENYDISSLITDESIDEAYGKTVKYLERLKHSIGLIHGDDRYDA